MKTIGLAPALFGVLAQRFDGCHGMTFRLRREKRPGVDGLAVE